MIEKLLKLGFRLVEINGEKAYSLTVKGTDRHEHQFVFYEDEKSFYINKHLIRGKETINESVLLDNHNNLSKTAKAKWLEIKDSLDGYDYKVAEAE